MSERTIQECLDNITTYLLDARWAVIEEAWDELCRRLVDLKDEAAVALRLAEEK